MTLSDKQFGSLHKKLMSGGFSAHSQTGRSPRVGYMVSLPGLEQQVRSTNVTPAHIKEFTEKHAAELSQPDRYIGGWENEGTAYLDVSQNIKPDQNVARKYGRKVASAAARDTTMDVAMGRNQMAAWDVEKGEELPNPHFRAPKRPGNDA